MRKYILAALLAGSVATPAFAQDAVQGVRIEGLVGYDSVDVDGENGSGVSYGVGVGFDTQVGSTVVGVEGEAMASEVEECVTAFTLPGDQLCAESGRDLYAGLRVGTYVGENMLLYAKAGYTNARMNLDYKLNATTAVVSTKDDLEGIRFGAGLQFGLGPNLFAKVEYRYSNYEQNFQKHQGVAGVGFKF